MSLRIAGAAVLCMLGVLSAVTPSHAAGRRALPEARSVEPRLQARAEALLKNSRAPEGAVLVSDVRTGRILAWASTDDGNWAREPHAPAASLFKLITATALLEKHAAYEDEKICIVGGGEHGIKTEAEIAKGTVCVRFGDSLGKSINLVFARLAHERLSPSDLRQTIARLGFNQAPAIDVGGSREELHVPDESFAMAKAAAGFNAGKISPLGILALTQAIAVGGESLELWLHKRQDYPRVVRGRAMSAETARHLRSMMSITTTRGTCTKAWKGAPSTMPRVAAKTGTLIESSPRRMISWFTGFAPADHPEIAVTVLLQDDISWWTKANIVGREVFAAYFQGKI